MPKIDLIFIIVCNSLNLYIFSIKWQPSLFLGSMLENRIDATGRFTGSAEMHPDWVGKIIKIIK
jgi:hypothetical protein